MMKDREVLKNTKTKKYPSHNALTHIIFQYLIDTGVYETFYLIFRDGLFGAHYQNIEVIILKKTLIMALKF